MSKAQDLLNKMEEHGYEAVDVSARFSGIDGWPAEHSVHDAELTHGIFNDHIEAERANSARFQFNTNAGTAVENNEPNVTLNPSELKV